ncbi:MAG: DUF3137 domain-containing protein [Leptolyngbyaceae cyanobacterium bins.59]|nr:DUF3137 domain-containing protein [Leptolyngbyaceae cyanobacterium bins.59]
MPPQPELLQSGLAALKQARYPEAIECLETFRDSTDDYGSPEYSQAMIGLATAYQKLGQIEQTIAICEWLGTHPNSSAQTWAKQALQFLQKLRGSQPEETAPEVAEPLKPQTSKRLSPSPPEPEAKPVSLGIKLRSLSELKSFFKKELLPDLKRIEAERQTIQRHLGIATLVGFIVFFWIIFSSPMRVIYQISVGFYLIILVLVLLGCLWAWALFYSSLVKTYGKDFKASVIKKLVSFIDANGLLEYSTFGDPRQTLNAFIRSQIFLGSPVPNRIREDDCIQGRLGETDIFFSEVCLHFEERRLELTRPNGYFSLFDNTNTTDLVEVVVRLARALHYIPSRIIKGQRIDFDDFNSEFVNEEVERRLVFKGLFLQADFNKNFKTVTVVIPKAFGARRIGELVKLEDPEFNKRFLVFADDQIEARYVLSTSLMERLVEFQKKVNRPVYAGFVDNQIFLAIGYDQDLFEPKVFYSMLHFSPIQEYFDCMQFMLGIVEDLNLNRRIWGK